MEAPRTFEEFKEHCCYGCNANDWYCPDLCVWMTKAQKYPLERLKNAFVKAEGDVSKIARMVDSWK